MRLEGEAHKGDRQAVGAESVGMGPGGRRAVGPVRHWRRVFAPLGFITLAILAGLIAFRGGGAIASGSTRAVPGVAVVGEPLPVQPVSTGEFSNSTALASARVWIVRPGDTLWSIALASGAKGDIRPLVDRLSKEVGGRPLQVGERIVLPGPRR